MLVFPVRISAHKFYGKWHYAYNIIKMIASQINTRDSEDTRKNHLNEQLPQNFISAKPNTNTLEHESKSFMITKAPNATYIY